MKTFNCPPMKAGQIFEEKPRWPGAPKICLATNRMAFATKADMDNFRKAIAMDGYPPGKVWECNYCKHIHYEGATPCPSGHTSGTTRKQKHEST